MIIAYLLQFIYCLIELLLQTDQCVHTLLYLKYQINKQSYGYLNNARIPRILGSCQKYQIDKHASGHPAIVRIVQFRANFFLRVIIANSAAH